MTAELLEQRWPGSWGATELERADLYPCDSYLPVPCRGLIRAVDVDAPPAVLFRWVCQLKVAPYSYDIIDNRGRRSPRQLTPGAEQLEVGQRFMVFRLVDFEIDRHISCVGLPAANRLFGPLAVTYVTRPRDNGGSRLIAKINVGAAPGWRRHALAWGDLVMMRKQLLTLKSRAER